MLKIITGAIVSSHYKNSFHLSFYVKLWEFLEFIPWALQEILPSSLQIQVSSWEGLQTLINCITGNSVMPRWWVETLGVFISM